MSGSEIASRKGLGQDAIEHRCERRLGFQYPCDGMNGFNRLAELAGIVLREIREVRQWILNPIADEPAVS